MLLGEGFAYTSWLRIVAYLHSKPKALRGLYRFARVFLSRYLFKLGISIMPRTQIGPWLYIGHWGTIVVSPEASIGRNCNISHGVTIGKSARGPRKGVPAIGDNVYIGPGAKIIGSIRVGNNVAIGANAVVTRDIPDNSVAAGIPAKVISEAGSEGYIANSDYDEAWTAGSQSRP